MFNKSNLAIVLLSAGILAGVTAALSPAQTVLGKYSPAANAKQRGAVTVAAVPAASAIQPPMKAIVPSPVIDPDANSFAGTGDNSAGVWTAK